MSFSPLLAANDIRDDPSLPPMAKLAAYTLISRATSKDDPQRGLREGEWTWSQRRIAKDANIARSTLQAALATLVEHSKVSVLPRTVEGTNERDVSTYRIEVGRLPGHVDRQPGDGGPVVGQQVDRQPVKGGPPAGQITDLFTDHLTDHLTPPLPRANEKPSKKDRRKPESSAPASDAPAADVEAWLTMWSIPNSDEAMRFVNHARSIDRRCRDWTAAWKNWEAKAREFAAARPGASMRLPNGQPRPADGNSAWSMPTEAT